MAFFVFLSGSDPAIIAFTVQRDGANLPAEFAPWKPLSGNAMPVITGLGGGSGSDVVLEAIRRDGFYLARSEDRIAHIEPRGNA